LFPLLDCVSNDYNARTTLTAREVVVAAAAATASLLLSWCGLWRRSKAAISTAA
jgi:hypothetical protein